MPASKRMLVLEFKGKSIEQIAERMYETEERCETATLQGKLKDAQIKKAKEELDKKEKEVEELTEKYESVMASMSRLLLELSADEAEKAEAYSIIDDLRQQLGYERASRYSPGGEHRFLFEPTMFAEMQGLIAQKQAELEDGDKHGDEKEKEKGAEPERKKAKKGKARAQQLSRRKRAIKSSRNPIEMPL